MAAELEFAKSALPSQKTKSEQELELAYQKLELVLQFDRMLEPRIVLQVGRMLEPQLVSEFGQIQILSIEAVMPELKMGSTTARELLVVVPFQMINLSIAVGAEQ